METKIYDLCVVGAGLIGSAAARHATVNPNVKVCVIGPDEPKDRASTDIFGAWYDEGRIARSTASDPLWGSLASRSIARYRNLEKRTGIHFYDEVGCLTVGPVEGEFFQNTHRSATEHGITVSKLDQEEVSQLFPYMKFFPGAGGVLEHQDAGYVNPRRMREAQLTAAHLQGCDIIKDVVRRIQEVRRSGGDNMVQITTDTGAVVLARKALLAVGSFVGFRDLLPRGMTPDIRATAQTVILAELRERDIQKLSKMPSVTYKHPMLEEDDPSTSDKYNCYILPPIKYPDGKVYLKIGHSTKDEKIEPVLHRREDITGWYQTAPYDYIQNTMLEIFRKAFNGIEPLSFHMDTCVTSHTSTRRPFIELLTPTLGVALGGNGYAAKSADELGKIAADYILSGTWTYDLPKEHFKYVTKPDQSKL